MKSESVRSRPGARWVTFTMLAALVVAFPVQAQLRLDITEGVRDAVPIAVVPFGGQAASAATDVAAVVANDLKLSGRFAPLERADMVTRPASGDAIRFQDWRLLKSDFIVVGRVEPDAAGSAVTFELFNVQTGQPLLTQRLPATERGMRAIAHRIADLVFERLTGIAGAFSTRVAYVSACSAAPAWSPDGKSLALTLSRDGNLDIYTLELASQTLSRVTSDSAIDTEPEWAQNGGSLYFTSDRAGSAQVYQVTLGGAREAQRLTFTNSYNARPRLSPDGESLAMVTLDRGGYRIATLDLKTRNLRVLTDATQDESPSFAPNGAVIIYATKTRGRGSLAMVSSDGRFQQRLSSELGDVREPVWSPFPRR